jgi:hypothetical protein
MQPKQSINKLKPPKYEAGMITIQPDISLLHLTPPQVHTMYEQWQHCSTN